MQLKTKKWLLQSYALGPTFKMAAHPTECSTSYLGNLGGFSELDTGLQNHPHPIWFALCTHHFIQCHDYLHITSV